MEIHLPHGESGTKWMQNVGSYTGANFIPISMHSRQTHFSENSADFFFPSNSAFSLLS